MALILWGWIFGALILWGAYTFLPAFGFQALVVFSNAYLIVGAFVVPVASTAGWVTGVSGLNKLPYHPATRSLRFRATVALVTCLLVFFPLVIGVCIMLLVFLLLAT